MELLKFTVRNQSLSGGRNRLVSDSIDYVEAYFDFRTSDWSGLSKWAHFSKGDEVYDVNLVDDKITKDMHLNLGAGIWEVKLHGTDPEGTMRITTGKAHVVVESYGRLEDGAPLPEVPLSAAEQIDAKSQKALDTANEVMRMAKEGEFDPVPGVDYWTEEDRAAIVEETVKLVKEGAKGERGKSAFEYAAEGGYTGTEEEFYKDLALSDERFEKIENDIEEILYVPIAFSSFSHNAGTRENGDVVNDIKLSWKLNKEPVSVTIDGTAVAEAKEGSKIFEDLDIRSNRTFEIEASDGKQTAKKSTTISFFDGIFYGCKEAPAAVDSAFIMSLTKNLSGGKNQTVSASGGTGKYFWYAYPASMGESIFNIGGFDYEYEYETVSFTNKFGVTKDYYVYVSGQPITGSISVTVKEG